MSATITRPELTEEEHRQRMHELDKALIAFARAVAEQRKQEEEGAQCT